MWEQSFKDEVEKIGSKSAFNKIMKVMKDSNPKTKTTAESIMERIRLGKVKKIYTSNMRETMFKDIGYGEWVVKSYKDIKISPYRSTGIQGPRRYI